MLLWLVVTTYTTVHLFNSFGVRCCLFLSLLSSNCSFNFMASLNYFGQCNLPLFWTMSIQFVTREMEKKKCHHNVNEWPKLLTIWNVQTAVMNFWFLTKFSNHSTRVCNTHTHTCSVAICKTILQWNLQTELTHYSKRK